MRQGDLAAILRPLPGCPWRERVAQAVAEGIAGCDAYDATARTIASAAMDAWPGPPASDGGIPWALFSVGKAAVGMARAVMAAATMAVDGAMATTAAAMAAAAAMDAAAAVAAAAAAVLRNVPHQRDPLSQCSTICQNH